MSSILNPFKQALQARRTQIGLWLSLADPYSAELLAGAGFDWVLIDGEHAPNDLRHLLESLRAVDSAAAHRPEGVARCHAIVRPPLGEAALIKQLLEIGAQSLLIPMVETAEQASRLVPAMRYPPHGIRGVGSSAARSSRWSGVAGYAGRPMRRCACWCRPRA